MFNVRVDSSTPVRGDRCYGADYLRRPAQLFHSQLDKWNITDDETSFQKFKNKEKQIFPFMKIIPAIAASREPSVCCIAC